MKYIIKNCPALCFPLKDNPECECNESVFNNACKDISDCLLKQIVTECKQAPMIDSEFSQRILELMEIEECE